MTYAKRAQSGQGTVLGTGASSETGGQVQSMLFCVRGWVILGRTALF